jgi:hypothetical protein
MIRVAMREDDIGHVRDSEPEPLDLPSCRQPLVELETGRVDGLLADSLQWAGDILQADAGVDECEAAVLFEQ